MSGARKECARREGAHAMEFLDIREHFPIPTLVDFCGQPMVLKKAGSARKTIYRLVVSEPS